MPLEPFKDPLLNFLIKGPKQSFLLTTAVRFPITRKTIVIITGHQLTDCRKLIIDLVLEVTLEGFIRISNISFTAIQYAAMLF